jgi:VIT1/CCC1 family predicted Fe2+/Mn2+ transporter
MPAPAKSTLITTADLLAGLQIFLLVFLCTLPVALPFAFITEIEVAVHTSNIVALVMLFIGGYILAGYAGFKKLKTAIVYTLLGVALVSITMALGG